MCAKDGKLLYAVRAGRLLTVNSDHADIAMFEGEFLGKNEEQSTSTKEVTPELADSTVEKHGGQIELYNNINNTTEETENQGRAESLNSNENDIVSQNEIPSLNENSEETNVPQAKKS